MKKDNIWYEYSTKTDEALERHEKLNENAFRLYDKLGYLPDSGKMLDIGCSCGRFMTLCREKGIDSYGIDVDEFIINKHSIKYCDIETDRIPFNKNMFDLVHSQSVLQHLTKPPLNLMREVKRVLKPDGLFILVTDNWQREFIRSKDNFRHVSDWSWRSVKGLLEQFDFEILLLQPKCLGNTWLWKLPFKWFFGGTVMSISKNNDWKRYV